MCKRINILQSIDEACELSAKFNKKGWRMLVLSGSDSEAARAAVIARLAGDEAEDALDYIISVDIFSEGVDVPEINQVIMLRPTESPIVFIQQSGCGLRKAEDKEYVVVIDFIENYRNNFMIPIALSGDRSYNKNNIRRYVTEGGRVISGAKKTYAQCIFVEKEGNDYGVSKSFAEMLQNEDYDHILEELINFGISRYKENFSMRYGELRGGSYYTGGND